MGGNDYQVIVVGGGLAGLGAAYHLTRQGISTLVLEREELPGGRAFTRPWGDARVECGAMFVAPGYQRVMPLLTELGMSDEVHPATTSFPVALRHGSDWRYLDYFRIASLTNAIELRDAPRLVAAGARLSAAALRALPKLRTVVPGDISGAAALDRDTVGAVLGPAGSRLGSLANCMLGYSDADLSMGVAAGFALVAGRAGGAAGFQPHYLERGTGSLTTELAKRCAVSCGVTVDNVRLREGTVTVTAQRGVEPLSYTADTVIMATPADITARIWPEAHRGLADFLSAVRYTKVRAVYLRLDEPYRHVLPDGTRVFCELIPSTDRGQLRGMGTMPMDWLVPSGGMALTGVIADRADDPLLALTDDELIALTEKEAIELHPQLSGHVVDRHVVNLDRYVPIYGPGYLRRLADTLRYFGAGPIQLAGDYLGTPTLEGALTTGQRAAVRTATYLGHGT